MLNGNSLHFCCNRRASARPTFPNPISASFKVMIVAVKDNLRVVLVATRNPLNIGAAARAMANLGFKRLRVVQPYDVAFREARSAVGAAPLLQTAEEFSSVTEAVADCRLVVGTTSVGHRQLQHPLLRLESGARLLEQALADSPAALLFGSEKFGLSNDDLYSVFDDWNRGELQSYLIEISRDIRAIGKKRRGLAAIAVERDLRIADNARREVPRPSQVGVEAGAAD